MSSSFFGLNIARTGLFVSQRALHVVSHNIANANTKGFSRQRLDTRQTMPDKLPAMQGTLGTGVDSESVIQIRDIFYDAKIRSEFSKKGEWSFRKETLDNIETIFGEPSKTGIKTVVDQLFSAFHQLSENAGDLSARALLRQRVIAFTESVSTMQNKLKTLQAQVDEQIKAKVSQINVYAEQIRDLNKTIYLTELDGSTSNDMRDQRALLIDKLSKIVNVDYFEDNQKHFTVMISGKPLVSHYDFDQLKTSNRKKKINPDDNFNLTNITWETGGRFKLYGGELKSMIDIRDNIEGDKKGIPYYVDRLNHYADRVASEISRIHQSGFDLTKNKGVMFFTKNSMSSSEYEEFLMREGLDGNKPMELTKQVLEGTSPKLSDEANRHKIAQNIKKILDNNPDNRDKSIKQLSDGKFYMVDRISADQLTISKDLEQDLNKFAAATTIAGLNSDGSNMQKIIKTRYNRYMFAWGSSDDYVNSLISNLGVDSYEADRMNKNQEKLILEVENKRQSVMGVSFDEEVGEMIKFQHAYNANARMLTTMDEMLDLLINRLGLVGR